MVAYMWASDQGDLLATLMYDVWCNDCAHNWPAKYTTYYPGALNYIPQHRATAETVRLNPLPQSLAASTEQRADFQVRQSEEGAKIPPIPEESKAARGRSIATVMAQAAARAEDAV